MAVRTLGLFSEYRVSYEKSLSAVAPDSGTLPRARRRVVEVLPLRRMNIFTLVRPAKGWHVQWETVPPGEKSETP